ncbi:sugar kinase [Clostridium massiliamazoniense]|uniref:sugar kinase n=1 Tax=Clostridium massiliamazoniense TaxID=1347366 RepID=UPI0006D7CDE8|nr:sugar kinase [Clostridium massiliamazoniense]
MSTKNLVNEKAVILGIGEIMMRLSPTDNDVLGTSNKLNETYGGGEGNVICSLANFNHKTKFFTKLPSNDLGKKSLKVFKERDVDLSNVIFGEGRLGIYFLEEGVGVRNSKVIYDRAYSAFSMIKEEEINYDELLKDVGLLHISGITAALSEEHRKITLNLVKEAKSRSILVSYDSNFRAKLWSAELCGQFLKEILNYVDIAFLGHLDITKLLNFNHDFIGIHKEDLKILYDKLQKEYPNIKVIASTKREIESARKNSLTGYIYEKGILVESEKYTFDILDRVGGGDAFSAGVLHGLIEGKSLKDVIEFGTVASVLKHSYKGDINYCTKEDVEIFLANGVSAIGR